MFDTMQLKTLGNVIPVVLAVICEIATVVVALGFVYKRNRGAAMLMLGSALVFALLTIASPVLTASLHGRMTIGDIVKIRTVVSIVFSAGNAAGWGLLLAGIVGLAKNSSLPRDGMG